MARTVTISDEEAAQVLSAAQKGADAAYGDSNDTEIELLRDALETALSLLGLEMPDGHDPDDEDDPHDSDGNRITTDWLGIGHEYAEYATPEVLRDHLVEHHSVAPTVGRALYEAGDNHLDNLHQMLHGVPEEESDG